MLKKFFFLLFFGCLQADSIYLVNDSPFLLTAIVKSRTGIVLAEKTMAPSKDSYDTTGLKSLHWKRPDARYALSPYVVIWQCQSGGFYSIQYDVLPGAFVNANGGTGNKYCQPKKR